MNQSNPDVYACVEVRAVARLHADLFSAAAFSQRSVRDQLDQQASRIVEAHGHGNQAVATHITCWHPQLVGCSTRAIMEREFTREDARETIAREYGFADWSDVEARGTKPPDAEFESAVNALLRGDLETLRTLLARRPSLTRERSCFGHHATLLHYCGSNGVETYRQVVPRNLAAVTQALLDAGADVNATAEMYGGGSTTMALLITSSHPAEAGVVDEVARVLLNAGAKTDS